MVDGVHIQFGALDLPREELAEARALLSEGERQRAERFLREEDRTRFVAARAMLRRAVGLDLGVAPERVAFDYGPHGKPALTPPLHESGLRFNLSHSADRALLATVRGRELGVDLEKLRPVRFGGKTSAANGVSDEVREALKKQ